MKTSISLINKGPLKDSGSQKTLLLPVAAALMLGIAPVHAATYYWDNNDSTAGFGTASGTWAAPTTNDATQGWSSSSNGTSALSGTTTTLGTNATTDALFFGTNTSGLASGTITVSGTVGAGYITVGSQSGALNLTGGSLSFNGTNSGITNNSANMLTIDSSIDFGSLAGSNTRVLAGGTGGITLNGFISANGSGPRANTSGNITINNSILNLGIQINSGTVSVGGPGLLWADISSSDVKGQGGTLNLSGRDLSALSISGGITITDNAAGNGTSTLTLTGSSSSQNGTTTGIIADGASRKVAIVYNGTGASLTLSANNTYSGSTKSAAATRTIILSNNQSIQNSAIDTSGNGTFTLGSGITTPTIGGLIGNKTLSTVFSGNATTFGQMTSLTLNTVSGSNYTYSSNITNTTAGLSLTKNGTGTQVLSGVNTYTGNTTINSGTLTLGAGGSIANSTNIVVRNGATFNVASVAGYTVGSTQTLLGSGTVTGNVTVNGGLQVGSTPGVLTFGNSLTLGSSGNVTLQVNGTSRGVNYDGISITNGLTYGGTLNIAIGSQFLSSDQTFSLFSLGSQSGDLAAVNLSGAYGSGSFVLSNNLWSYTDSNSNQWTFDKASGNLAFFAVPEPSTWVLVALGFIFLLWGARRKSSSF
ncbi:MAG: autotransporter-associated beta strand repeat-containing protein [bacterium]